METRFEKWRQEGVSPEDAQKYAKWLQNDKLPLRKEGWIPTPLPVAYWGADMQIVCLPFLDLSKRTRVFGVVCGGVCYQRKLLMDEVYRYGMLSVCESLKELRNHYYPRSKNVIGRILAAESIYARNFVIPTLDQMQRAYMQKDAFDETFRILQENDIFVDFWADGDFICRDYDDAEGFHQVVDFATGLVKDYAGPEQNGGKLMQARAATVITDRDPECPIEKVGERYVFNWEQWRECESAFEL